MKNLYKWLLMAVFALTITISFNACNKVKVADKGEHAQCKNGCQKACDHHEHMNKTHNDSADMHTTHVCDANCETNGCTHQH